METCVLRSGGRGSVADGVRYKGESGRRGTGKGVRIELTSAIAPVRTSEASTAARAPACPAGLWSCTPLGTVGSFFVHHG